MKTTSILIAALLVASAQFASAQPVEIKVEKIRNDKGSILLMANASGSPQPIYRMEAASRDGVLFRLDSLGEGTVEISILHDENGNYRMDKDDNGMPLEGFAGKNFKAVKDATVRVAMTYLTEEER